jgi:hypothetical protein
MSIASTMTALLFLTALPTLSQAGEMSISGTPSTTARVGEEYRFLPTVENANMNDLSFSYINLPSWSKHYRSSGLIQGVPTEPGVFDNIQIEVWDGLHYAVLPPFTITVKPAQLDCAAPSGVARLSWTIPVANTDGSALTNLAGYLIRYGTNAALFTQISVHSAESTEAEIDNLPAGSYYFSIAAVNAADVRSDFLEVVSKVH